MKKLCALLLILTLLTPAMTLASDAGQNPEASVALALDLLEKAAAAMDEATRLRQINMAAKTAPESCRVLVGCARALLQMDQAGERYDQAEAYLLRAMQVADDGARREGLMLLAELYLYADRAGDAIALVAAEAEAMPEDESLVTLLATTLYYGERAEDALSALTALLERNPQNHEALDLYATILYSEYRWDEALEAYKVMQERYPGFLDGMIGQYAVLTASGRFDRALRMLDTILMSGGGNDLWVERARTRLWKLYQPEAALKEAEALIKSNPNWIDAEIIVLGANLMLERNDEARAAVERVRAMDPAFGDFLAAVAALDMGEFGEAASLLEAFLANNATHALAWAHLSAARLEAYDDIDGAQEALSRAFALALDSDTLYLRLGTLRRRQGAIPESARAFATAAELTSEDPSHLYYLMLACGDAGRADALEETLARMEREYPGWYETLLARVIAMDYLGRADEALEAFSALKEKFPFPAEQDWQLEALLLATCGDESGAAMFANRMDETSAEDMSQYAYALMLLGRYDEAEEALAKAESLLPEGEAQAGVRRAVEISVATTRAGIRLRQGDAEGCAAHLAEAAERGWAVTMALGMAEYEALRGTEAYAALLAQYGAKDEGWDISIMPILP